MKQESDILLSICIPTFNRLEFLKEGLLCLKNQIDLLNQNQKRVVEIIVVDNASVDKTEDLIHDLENQFLDTNFHYHKRESNIGADNVYLCTEFACGEFILILSDDDLLSEGGIERVIYDIQSNKIVDAITYNIMPFKNNSNVLYTPAFKRSNSTETPMGHEILEEIGGMITFLSIMVYRRSLVAGKNYDFCRNENLIQSYAFMDVLNLGKRFIISEFTLIRYRDDNTTGWSFFRVMIRNYIRLLNYGMKIGIKRESIIVAKKWQVFNVIYPKLLHFKFNKKFGEITPSYRECLKYMLRYYWDNPRFWLQILPIILMPPWLLSSAKPVYQILKKVVK